MTAADLASNATAPLAGVCAVDYTNRYGVIQPAIERINASAHLTKRYGETGEAYLELNFIQSSSFYTANPAVIRGSAPAGIFYKQFSTATSGPTYADGSGILALPAYVCARNGASATMVNGVPTVAGCGASNGTLNPNNPFAASGQVARIVGRDLGTPPPMKPATVAIALRPGRMGRSPTPSVMMWAPPTCTKICAASRPASSISSTCWIDRGWQL
jgi:iron complex outermembrane receptor protein